jgi:glycine/D-amino acid oxidase-like deaminating enzyme/nitrite reductase/ring-hydroxylating ferredoxin subunit
MNVSGERSKSLWMQTADLQRPAPLTEDARADIVIVGAGMAGLSAAYELSRAGRSVIVLDRGPLAGGMSARTSAHLASQFDDYYHRHIHLRGEDETRRYYESQAAAIDRIEAVQRDEGIDCDFRRLDGFLFLAPGDDPMLLEHEIASCHRIGFSDVAWAERAPIPGIDTGRCLRFPRQARFHPLRYLNGLVRCIRRDGGRLFADTPVNGIVEQGGQAVISTATGATVRAGSAIVATNAPINDWIAIHTKQAPYRTYVLAARVPRGTVTDALYWDTPDPYHYVRLQPGAAAAGGSGGDDFLIVGGEDHKTGEASDMEERFARLEAWTRRCFPAAGAVAHRWSGQVMEPVDHAPLIGRNHGNEHIYVSTGDSGEGLTTGAVAGMLLRDLILGRDNRWGRAYEPQRVTLGAVGEYVRENATVAANFTEYVRPGELASCDALRPGHGAVIRQGGRKVAAYRDESGQLHLRSAICSHAGCIVHWNDFEQCWDCPCHGSQFSIDGEPINGPALTPLSEIAPAAESGGGGRRRA